jgi:hypothetical protein
VAADWNQVVHDGQQLVHTYAAHLAASRPRGVTAPPQTHRKLSQIPPNVARAHRVV